MGSAVRKLTPTRVAVIGLGSMGRNHARILNDLDECTLVAVCDAIPTSVEWAVSRYGVKGYGSYTDMFAKEKLDAVVVAVPTSLHLEVGMAALRQNLHTLIEKPIAGDMEDAKTLAREAEQRGRRLAVGHVERFNPAVRELKARLTNGELGRILQIHARRLGPFPPRIRDVGVVIDLATHDLDVMSHLIGEEVVRLFAETERKINTAHEDMLSAILKFESGTVGVLDVNWLTPTKVRDLSVLGERGMFHVNYLSQDLTFYANSAMRPDQDASMLSSVTEGNMVRYQIGHAEPLRVELQSFIDSVASGSPLEVGAADGIRALRLATQLMESAERGEAIDVLSLKERREVDAYQ
jgi:UDP-N-acetylglucosamine 3-dehydrogenase